MKSILNIMLAIGVFALSSCYEPSDPRVKLDEEVRSDTLGSNIVTRPVGAAFSALIGEGIEIERVVTQQNKGGFMEVHVQGYNRAVGVKRFEYRVEWFDAKGLLIDSTTSTWLPVSAKGKSSFSFKAVAPTREAVDFKINTRK